MSKMLDILNGQMQEAAGDVIYLLVRGWHSDLDLLLEARRKIADLEAEIALLRRLPLSRSPRCEGVETAG